MRGALTFDCDFEAGNVQDVNQISEHEYDVTLRPDTLSPP
jgi:hypothetical protein